MRMNLETIMLSERNQSKKKHTNIVQLDLYDIYLEKENHKDKK